MTKPLGRYPIQAILNHLSSLGLVGRNGAPCIAKIFALPFESLVDLGVFIAQAGANVHRTALDDIRIDCASIGLSGGEFPCAAPDCRLDQARQLARYAIMLSDCVYTFNPFSQYTPSTDGTVDICDSDDLRWDFFVGLSILKEWEPLISQGLIFPFPHADHWCQGCLAKKSFGDDAAARLDKAVRRYEKRFVREITFTISKDKFCFNLQLNGPEDLLIHGQSVMGMDELPKVLRTPKNLKILASRKSLVVQAREIRTFGLKDRYSSEILQSLRYGLAANQLLGSTYATDSSAEVDMLTAISGHRDIIARNRIAAQHLSSVIPFLPEIPINALINLRNAEGDTFIRYRSALVKATAELSTGLARKLTEDDARTLFGDVISPELARIDILVAAARRKSASRAIRSLVGWGSALTIGLYSGLISADLREVAKVFGVAGAKDLISRFAKVPEANQDIRQENFYFLWRTRKLRQ